MAVPRIRIEGQALKAVRGYMVQPAIPVPDRAYSLR